MAELGLSLPKVWENEFSNNTKLFVHKNGNEIGLTVGGLYEKYNKNNLNFSFIKNVILACNNDMKRASNMLYYDEQLQAQIKQAYDLHYWRPLKLDEVESQKKADAIFLFGIVSGVKNSAKLTQKICKVKVDGIIGAKSLEAINEIDEFVFLQKMKDDKIDFFKDLVAQKPSLGQYLKGWINRAKGIA